MKSNLYFYKLPVNFINKNFVLESLESYLAGFTPVTKTDFQYLRLNMTQTIKVNMSQDYQLNIASMTKYNYLKVTTQDSGSPAKTATYYYFIKTAKQISESTIEFEIVMDVLNTFSFSGSAAPNTYTLSNKSLIKREHKDRLEFVKNKTFFKEKEATAEETLFIQAWKDEIATAMNFGIKFNFRGLKSKIIEYPPIGLSFPVNIAPNGQTYKIYLIDEYGDIVLSYDNITQINIAETYFQFVHDGISESFIYNDNLIYTLVIHIESYLGDSPSAFSPTATWDYIKEFFLENVVYKQQTDKLYKRNIYEYQEGLGTILFKKREETLYDEDGINQWYVMYASTYAPTQNADDTEAKYVNPVAVRFYSDKGYSVTTASSKIVTFYAKDLVNYTDYAEYILLNAETLGTGYFEYNGVQYHASDIPTGAVGFAIRRDTKSLFSYLAPYSYTDFGFRYEWAATDSHSISFIRFYGINQVPVYKASGSISTTPYNATTKVYIGSGAGSLSGNAPEWDKVDLTSALLIKAFAFPYAPTDWLVGKTAFDALPSNVSWSSDGDCFELVAPQEEPFDRNIQFNNESPLNNCFIKNIVAGQSKARNILYESKLFHSDYFQPKFVYDSFAFSFNLENVNVDLIEEDQLFMAQYVVSKNVVSKFGFIFNQYVCKRETQNYNNVLTIERNNEKALYNNAYINYIRSGGYSYDTKKASSQNAVNGLTTALSIMGGTASLAAGWGTGNPALMTGGIALLTSSAAMIVRNIHTAQEQDRSIGQKLNEQVMQGTSVQGSEDIDILTAFSGNKAKLVYYELSDIMKNAMWDLFHYCGYATHEQKVPVVNTRLYFNYVQGEIILKDFTFNDDIAKAIIEKWNQGITFMHWVNGAYDLDQEYENFETSLL